MPLNYYDEMRLQILSMPDEQLKDLIRTSPPTITDFSGIPENIVVRIGVNRNGIHCASIIRA